MSEWDGYVGDAETATGEWPLIPDDLYDAQIMDVGEPETKPDFYKPDSLTTDFWLQWELLSDELPEGTWLRQWVRLPERYVKERKLSEKSTLYHVMECLGFDMAGTYEVNPPSWQGKRARVMGENRETGDKGEKRPRVTAVHAPRARPSVSSFEPGTQDVGGQEFNIDDEPRVIDAAKEWAGLRAEMTVQQVRGSEVKAFLGEFSEGAVAAYLAKHPGRSVDTLLREVQLRRADASRQSEPMGVR